MVEHGANPLRPQLAAQQQMVEARGRLGNRPQGLGQVERQVPLILQQEAMLPQPPLAAQQLQKDSPPRTVE